MRSRYSVAGKIREPITLQELEQALDKLKPKYRAYAVLLFYTGVRVSEALRLVKEDFTFGPNTLYVEFGVRLKHGRQTQPLPLDLHRPYMDLLTQRVKHTRTGMRVFRFTRSTAYKQIRQAGLGYNHRFRLTAITFYLQSGYSVADVVNWFGISVQTINDYIGLVNVEKMGRIERV